MDWSSHSIFLCLGKEHRERSPTLEKYVTNKSCAYLLPFSRHLQTSSFHYVTFLIWPNKLLSALKFCLNPNGRVSAVHLWCVQIEVMHDYQESRSCVSYSLDGDDSPDLLKRWGGSIRPPICLSSVLLLMLFTYYSLCSVLMTSSISFYFCMLVYVCVTVM